MWLSCFVGQGFPFGEEGERLGRKTGEGRKETEVVVEALGSLVRTADDEPGSGSQGACLRISQYRQGKPPHRPVQPCQARSSSFTRQCGGNRSEPLGDGLSARGGHRLRLG